MLCGSSVEVRSPEVRKSDGVCSYVTLLGLGVDVGGVGAGRFFLGVFKGV